MTRKEKVIVATKDVAPNDNGWANVQCPFCVDIKGTRTTRKTLGLNVESGYYHCFRCEVFGYTRDRVLCEKRLVVEEEVSRFDLPKNFHPLWTREGRVHADLEPAREFLNFRGIPTAVWGQARIGACLSGDFKMRVVIPVITEDHVEYDAWTPVSGIEYYGFVARSWSSQTNSFLRYMYPKGMDRGRLLFNSVALTEDTNIPIILAEGVMDALPYWPHGVALLGKPTGQQLKILAKTKRRICVCLDGDAWREAKTFANRLKLRGVDASWVKLPAGSDPNTIDKTWLLQKVNESYA